VWFGCGVDVESSGKHAKKAITSSAIQTARKPQLEWLRNEIAASKFIALLQNRMCGVSAGAAAESIMRQTSGLSALEVQPTGCRFVFLQDQFNGPELLIRAQTALCKLSLNFPQPVANPIINSERNFLGDQADEISLCHQMCHCALPLYPVAVPKTGGRTPTQSAHFPR
jgi:hypothetical protein